MVNNMFEDDDLIDEYFEYDMVMNDGKDFFDDDKKKHPKGGCLTAVITIFCIVSLFVLFANL